MSWSVGSGQAADDCRGPSAVISTIQRTCLTVSSKVYRKSKNELRQRTAFIIVYINTIVVTCTLSNDNDSTHLYTGYVHVQHTERHCRDLQESPENTSSNVHVLTLHHTESGTTRSVGSRRIRRRKQLKMLPAAAAATRYNNGLMIKNSFTHAHAHTHCCTDMIQVNLKRWHKWPTDGCVHVIHCTTLCAASRRLTAD